MLCVQLFVHFIGLSIVSPAQAGVNNQLSICCVCCTLLQLVDSSKVSEYQAGQQLDISSIIKEGDNIDIAGTTVGKGFQGKQMQYFCSL